MSEPAWRVSGLDDLDCPEEDLAGVSIDADGIAGPKFKGVNSQDLCLFVNMERFTSGDTRFCHSARIDRSVGCHSAFAREDSS